ncbi:hypothetical protein [Solimonas terrae]|uniref:hypothetical protein n=1 Tax=Solimonas terrae TaxID=1396819 RepID=UPI0019D66FD5|nr:hypothetical protein [Solimonas terrae]
MNLAIPKTLMAASLCLNLAACGTPTPATHADPAAAAAAPMVGGDRDAHGCIGSAGYLWCAHTHQCERPWELAARAGFDSGAAAYDAYCAQLSQKPNPPDPAG